MSSVKLVWGAVFVVTGVGFLLFELYGNLTLEAEMSNLGFAAMAMNNSEFGGMMQKNIEDAYFGNYIIMTLGSFISMIGTFMLNSDDKIRNAQKTSN